MASPRRRGGLAPRGAAIQSDRVRDFDAIVVGSGAGGLTAALAIARAGRRVAVSEQHHLAGGYGQSFTIGGFSFSPGVHYVGQLGPRGGLRRNYEGLGVSDDLVFLELDPDGHDRAVVGDVWFDIPKGRERFAERLRESFPAEAAGIDGYLAAVARLSDELAWAKPPESVRDAERLPFRMPTVLRYGMLPLARFLDRFTRDPLLRAILSMRSGDHARAPARARPS